jgi:RNA polymerase sigma-70 factor (ECF subfamily)
VLDVPAAEVATLIGTSGNAVHTMTHRSRARLARTRPGDRGATSPEDRTLEEYAAAFENGDVSAFTHALAEDATFTRGATRVSGREALLEFLARCPVFRQYRKIPVNVRGNHGFGVYRPDGDDTYRAYAIEVLTITPGGIRRIDVVEDRALFPAFGLPLTVSRAGAGA